MDRALLADFLRARRVELTPVDVGLPQGTRRRTPGLRREEVAMLAGMSTDYYSRIEQQRGPLPSEQILTALARAMRLDDGQRDHLFGLAGHAPPRRYRPDNRVSPAMRRVVDRLVDTPAVVFSRFGEALLQTSAATALFGDYTVFDGLSRYLAYRWFTDPAQRALYPERDHEIRGRVFIAELRASHTDDTTGVARSIVDALLDVSPEFTRLWNRHEVGLGHYDAPKAYVHPVVGELELVTGRLVDPEEGQELLVFLAEPGTASADKLAALVAGAPTGEAPRPER